MMSKKVLKVIIFLAVAVMAAVTAYSFGHFVGYLTGEHDQMEETAERLREIYQ